MCFQGLRALRRERPVDVLAEEFHAIGAVLEGIGQAFSVLRVGGSMKLP
jgi:hypothetical protein